MATRGRSRTSKRDLITPKGSKRYVKRNPHGEFKKEVSVGAHLPPTGGNMRRPTYQRARATAAIQLNCVK